MISTEKVTGRATSTIAATTTRAALAGVAVLGEVAAHVLGHDDRGVHHHADGEGEPAEAHEVGRTARPRP